MQKQFAQLRKSLKFFILLAYNSEILSIFAIEIVIKV